MRDVARDDERSRQRQPRLDRELRQRRADLGHRPRQVDAHDVARQCLAFDFGQEARGVGLQLLEEHAVLRDLALGLTVRGARHADADRAARAVARQPDHAHVVAEVLAAELRADAVLARDLQHLLLQLQVAERAAARVASRRQRVEVARARELDGLHRELGRHAADDDREVVRRARCGAELARLLVDPLEQRLRVEPRLRLLEQERLVGRPAALRHEQEAVFVARSRIQLDLRRQVVAGVDLLVHVERRHLRVAQVGLGERAVHATAQRNLVVA